MSPATHFLVGWAVANTTALDRRSRALVALAGVAPDLDALGIVPELLTRGTRLRPSAALGTQGGMTSRLMSSDVSDGGDATRPLCSNSGMRFEVLFDHAEASAVEHAAYARYGKLGFPEPPRERPWIYSNFVQTLDGIASLRGKYASGFHISQSEDDRWLMDLLRAHADGILMGIGTLVEETEMAASRGPVFRIMDEQCRDLRRALGRGRERNIFVTSGRTIDLSAYRVFDGEHVEPVIVTTRDGEEKLRKSNADLKARVIVAGDSLLVDLPLAARLLREQLGIRYLLCEGGPTLYGHMSRGGLVDEKFMTVSPVEVGLRIPPEQEPSASEAANPPVYRPTVFDAPGFTKDTAPWWRWMSCRKAGDHQFSRYRRVSSSE